MSGSGAQKVAAVLAGAVVLFIIGCTPDSSSSGSSNPSSLSTGGQVASKSPLVAGGTNDPTLPDPPGDIGGDPVAGDPGTDPPDDGSSASCPEPATGLLFLCAAGSAALARLRARKRA